MTRAKLWELGYKDKKEYYQEITGIYKTAPKTAITLLRELTWEEFAEFGMYLIKEVNTLTDSAKFGLLRHYYI